MANLSVLGFSLIMEKVMQLHSESSPVKTSKIRDVTFVFVDDQKKTVKQRDAYFHLDKKIC